MKSPLMKEHLYTVSSPHEKPLSTDIYSDYKSLLANPEAKKAIRKANDEYLHWEELKYKSWLPAKDLRDKERFWGIVKVVRMFGARSTPIKDVKDRYFQMNLSHYSEFLHVIDKEMAGNFMGTADFSESDKKQFITRNIIEESIASSQLEGANTSRAAAKKMLLEGRKPHDHSEQMIVNNHRTMLKIEQVYYKEELSWDLICELHRMITYKTIPEDKQGKLRNTLDEKGNRLVIKPWDNKTIAYITPDREFVENEIPRFIDFANDKKTEEENFVHPLIKAIMLHFWVGLLHPFEDGNGRLARALFYWYMLRKDYWAFAYLSLSEKIKKSPVQYAMAYIYSEQDDCDLTYFINYNINKLKLARKEFQDYIKNKVNENRLIVSLSQREHAFNERQIKLLQYFNQKTENRTNIVAHQKLYSVTKMTAINDLKKLVEKGFLIKRKQGRCVYYYPTEKIAQLFKF